MTVLVELGICILRRWVYVNVTDVAAKLLLDAAAYLDWVSNSVDGMDHSTHIVHVHVVYTS